MPLGPRPIRPGCTGRLGCPGRRSARGTDVMSRRRPLILDLDGTLLHAAAAPGSIVVPGRTRPSYLGGETISALGVLAARFDIVLPPARSSAGPSPVLAALVRRGIDVTGVVLEDGGLLGPPGACWPMESHRQWAALRVAIDRV